MLDTPPITTDDAGALVVCRACFPMFATLDQIHGGHLRRDFGVDVTIWESQNGVPVQLEHVVECVQLQEIPGLLLFELVFDGAYVFCRRHGHAEILQRIRYAPSAWVEHGRES